MILSSVAIKQKRTNLPFQALLKSTFAKSANSITGSGTRNTKAFIFVANSSSIQFNFRKNSPRTISKKIGTVAFKLKIKLSI